MIIDTQGEIEKISAHFIANKNEDDHFSPSENELDTNDEELVELLKKYFLSPFKGQEFYNFTFSNNEFHLNPLYNYCNSIFEDDIPFHENSIKISQYLFDVSSHPNIKTGDFFVVHFSNINLDNELVEAIGLFKSENKHTFIKADKSEKNYTLDYEQGINIEKLDKGCLILNKNKSEGFKVCIVDKSNKGEEAQYWKENFLNLKPCNDDFHNTKAFLNIAKSYVSEQLDEEFEIEKTEKIGILNRSVEYFKSHEAFNKEEFEEEVFQNENVINSFRTFDSNYRTEHEIEVQDDFDISTQAVKKQSRFFKSILKLDKNFHVYIHGDKDMIERGVESDGRKFYKIYYEKED